MKITRKSLNEYVLCEDDGSNESAIKTFYEKKSDTLWSKLNDEQSAKFGGRKNVALKKPGYELGIGESISEGNLSQPRSKGATDGAGKSTGGTKVSIKEWLIDLGSYLDEAEGKQFFELVDKATKAKEKAALKKAQEESFKNLLAAGMSVESIQAMIAEFQAAAKVAAE